ncbi:hypothetical protein [Thalassotalea euphylliae]|uniref:Uncharacterized protein n=1 Tax=Thalassotalea euphylliae TaxID=1655234 RepID=A0A3E0UHZ7_9GAMM|nr:hypothetical protein [Thalassotalea euphylliae]REL36509.1 hypothetical protein DXX92_14955 [Thalassotalea euphylliae]
MTTSALARRAITIFQDHIEALGYRPLVHFELEGCCHSSQIKANQEPFNRALSGTKAGTKADNKSATAAELSHRESASHKTREYTRERKLSSEHFVHINKALQHAGIEGQLVAEYWHNQWEYVSLFAGQSPLKEAQNLAQAMQLLPKLFAQHGFDQTLIKPVVWSGDQGQLALGSKNIFTEKVRAVHIPNAIQVNVSVLDRDGKNLVAHDNFGEILQRCFLNTSLANCLLFMPEPDAFERLALKNKYGLAQELCSPTDISGGHQGSIALYKERGKHNQPMGVEVILYDQHSQALLSEQNWQKTARVEHRLGSASMAYDPYVNVVFALANLVDALEAYHNDKGRALLATPFIEQALPVQMYSREKEHHQNNGLDSKCVTKQTQEPSAYELFAGSDWLAKRINRSGQALNKSNLLHRELGEQLTRSVLTRYQPNNNIALLTTG